MGTRKDPVIQTSEGLMGRPPARLQNAEYTIEPPPVLRPGAFDVPPVSRVHLKASDVVVASLKCYINIIARALQFSMATH